MYLRSLFCRYEIKWNFFLLNMDYEIERVLLLLDTFVMPTKKLLDDVIITDI